jgi:hypothetical protein
METLKLSDDVRSSMRSFYEEELEKTLRRLEHIESVLTRLGGATKKSAGAPAARRGRPKSTAGSVQTAGVKRGKRGRKSSGRRGPKPRWEGLIIERMTKINRPVTYEELTEDIMSATKTEPARRQQLKQSVLNVTFRLRQRDKAIRTVSSGTRVKYLALSKWFDDKGQIKPEYKKLIKPVAVKARKKRKAASTKIKKGKVGRRAGKVVAKAISKATNRKNRGRKAAPKAVVKTSKRVVKAKKKVASKVAKKVAPKPVVVKSVRKAAKSKAVKKAVKPAPVASAKKAVKGGSKPVLKVKGASAKPATPSRKAASPKGKPSGATPLSGKKSSRNTIPNAPNWTEYVQAYITKVGKPVLANAILTSSMSELKIDKAYKAKVRTAIARCMSQLEKSGNKLRRVNPTGSKPHSYGMGSWFDASGALKSEFSGK